MAKRGAESELNDRNWDDEEEAEEEGTFIQASTDIMQQRVIKKAKRRVDQDMESGSKPLAFGGFGGFAAKSNTPATFETSTVKFGGNLAFSSNMPSFRGASSLNGSDEKILKGQGDCKGSSSYLHALKSLNESVLAWIKQHVEENPYIFLTPIFKDYERHLESLEENKSPGSSSMGGASNKNSMKTLDSTSTFAKTSLTSPLTTTTGSPSQDEKDYNGKEKSVEEKSKGFSFGLSAPKETETKPSSIFSGISSSNGNFKFNTSGTTTGFSFGSKNDSSSTFGKPAESFGSSTIFGSQASTQGGGSSLFSFAAGASTASASQGSSQTSGNKDDEEYVPPKPEVKEITEEDALHSQRCKLYYQRDGEWVDRGVGNVHLKPVAENKTQVLIRADTNLGNILLNVMLSTTMPVSRQGKNNVFLACVPNPPISSKPEDESNDTPVPMLIRVKTADDADTLFGKIKDRKELL